MNLNFSRPAVKQQDVYVPLGKVDLKHILCLEYEQMVGNDYVVRFENHLFQILKFNKKLLRQKDKVTL